MKVFYLLTFFLFCVFLSFGQKKEKQFYYYLQHKISELNGDDSLVIDQMSNEGEKYNWQAVIKNKGDSCIVIFLPPQLSQDTMVLPDERIVPLNTFITRKADLISSFENAKNELNKMRTEVSVEISITHFFVRKPFPNFKIKIFYFHQIQALYYRLRYNKSYDSTEK